MSGAPVPGPSALRLLNLDDEFQWQDPGRRPDVQLEAPRFGGPPVRGVVPVLEGPFRHSPAARRLLPGTGLSPGEAGQPARGAFDLAVRPTGVDLHHLTPWSAPRVAEPNGDR